MKNRYCLYCGTLLPEDGICLRCGTKYQLDENGQLKVIPRRVKKVSAKPTPKKKFSVKKKTEASETETQTIHIPEDIFSFSDDAKRQEKRTDWTNSQNDGEYYVPNFVFQNDINGFDNQREQASDSLDSQAELSQRKKSSPAALLAVFLIISVLSASLSFLLLKQWKAQPSGNPSKLTQQINGEEAGPVDYSSVLNAYEEYEKKGFRRVTSEYVNEDIDYIVDAKTDKIAYVYYDLNNDGIDELLISLTDENNINHSIYDIYTYSDKPERLVNPGTWFHPDSNEGLYFYTNGEICFIKGPMEDVGDSRIKAFEYITYSFPAKSTSLKEIEKYNLSIETQNGMNKLTAEKTTFGDTEPCSMEDFGKIDDRYSGFLVDADPYEETFFAKWNSDNPVLQLREYSWKHLIETVFDETISEDNRIAITTFQDALDTLYWKMERPSSILYTEDESWPFEIITEKDTDDENKSWSDRRATLEEGGEFFIEDIDNDGVLEFGLKNRIGPSAAFEVAIYRCTGLSHMKTAISSYDFEFYKNGVLAGLAGHNQSWGEMWPSYFFKLDSKKEYNQIGEAFSWDMSLIKEGFPSGVDKDSNGIVYTVDGGKSWIDDQAYNAWFNNNVGSEKRKVQWYTINEKNVTSFKKIALASFQQ